MQSAFPLYGLIISLCSGGLTPVISAKVSRIRAQNGTIASATALKTVLSVFFISLVPALVMACFCRTIAGLQGNADSAPIYVVLSLSVSVSCASAALRGFFQGELDFMRPALSTLISQLFKAAAGLAFVLALLPMGTAVAAVGGTAGVTLSEIAAALYLLRAYKKVHRNDAHGDRADNALVRRLLRDSLPVTLSGLIMPAVTFIESIFVMRLLSASLGTEQATVLYGLKEGALAPIIALPATLYSAMSTYFLPKLVRGQKDGFSDCLSAFFAAGLMCSFFMSVFSGEIVQTLYQSMDGALSDTGSYLLRIAACSSLFSAVWWACLTVLRATEQWRNITVITAISAVIRLLTGYVFTMRAGIEGSALAAAVSGAAGATAGLIAAARRSEMSLNIRRLSFLFLPVMCEALACAALLPLFAGLPPFVRAALCVTNGSLPTVAVIWIIYRGQKKKTVVAANNENSG